MGRHVNFGGKDFPAQGDNSGTGTNQLSPDTAFMVVAGAKYRRHAPSSFYYLITCLKGSRAVLLACCLRFRCDGLHFTLVTPGLVPNMKTPLVPSAFLMVVSDGV